MKKRVGRRRIRTRIDWRGGGSGSIVVEVVAGNIQYIT